MIIFRQWEKDSFNIALTIISELGPFNIAVDFVRARGGVSHMVTALVLADATASLDTG